MAKRGGKRQGTPGRAYLNRTDLTNNYRPQDVTATAAAGPFSEVPTANKAAPTVATTAPAQPPPNQWVSPDDIPGLMDPTTGGDETAGLGVSPALPAPDYVNKLYAAYNLNPTPQLRYALNYMISQGF